MRNGKTRVLLVYPEIPRSFWDFKAAIRILGLDSTMPPLGLATIAAMLPQEYFEMRPIIDLNFRTLEDGDILWADVVMISAMLVQSESVRQIIEHTKRLHKTTIVGGPFPTSYRDEVLAMGADILILGEAEITLRPFIEDWICRREQRVYDEATLRSRSSVELNAEGKPAITTTPIPLWHLLEMGRYSSMAVQFSRGCPFDCEFCDIVNLFGHAPRVKTSAQMIAEIESIRVTGWRGSIFIVDDNFIGNRKGVQLFLIELLKWQESHGFPFSFFTEASINLANDDMKEILDLMVRAGFEEVFIGIESNNPEVLARMGKRQNKGDLSEKVASIQRAGLNVTAGFIIGADGDSATAFPAMFSFIQDNGIVFAMLGLMTAIRGTRLYTRLKEEGRLRYESSGNNTHQFKLNFDPTMNESALIKGYVRLLSELYSREHYYDRCRTLQKRLGHGTKRASQINWRYARAMLRVLYYNLIECPDWEFVRFIVMTVCTHPNKFPEAISEAAKFRHLREITETTVANYHLENWLQNE